MANRKPKITKRVGMTVEELRKLLVGVEPNAIVVFDHRPVVPVIVSRISKDEVALTWHPSTTL